MPGAGDLFEGPPRLHRLGFGARRVAPGIGRLVIHLNQQPLRILCVSGAQQGVPAPYSPPGAESRNAASRRRVSGLQKAGHRGTAPGVPEALRGSRNSVCPANQPVQPLLTVIID